MTLSRSWFLLGLVPAAVYVLWRRRRDKSRQGPRLKPKRLILVRHGESQGNVDKSIYATTPDHALHLTERGWIQAQCAGRELRSIIGDEPTVFYVSPYVRTRETLHAISQ